MRSTRTVILVAALAGATWLTSPVIGAPPSETSAIDNGVIRVGIDLRHGGAISLLEDIHRTGNAINTHDGGRYVSQSYYAGPKPFGKPHPGWPNWPWNPVSGGDAYGNPSRILETRRDDHSIYVKSRPIQWALNHVAGDCTFETWITLAGRVAKVRCRLVNERDDHTQYPAMDQELPAVYSVGTLHRLITYSGDHPFADDKVSEVPKLAAKPGSPRWSQFFANESWAALVGEDDWGLGVIHPGVVRFLGGFYGKPGAGESTDDATGYLAPIRKEILDHDITFDYEFELVLDTLKNIRAEAYRVAVNSAPDYQFTYGRQHCWFENALDTGMPIGKHMVLDVASNDPQMIGPESWWDAKDAPRLWLRAAFHTASDAAEVYWQCTNEAGFSAEHRIRFKAITDGQFHTYELDLAAHPSYTGAIRRLRFDPVDRGRAGETVEIESISARRPSPGVGFIAPQTRPD